MSGPRPNVLRHPCGPARTLKRAPHPSGTPPLVPLLSPQGLRSPEGMDSGSEGRPRRGRGGKGGALHQRPQCQMSGTTSRGLLRLVSRPGNTLTMSFRAPRLFAGRGIWHRDGEAREFRPRMRPAMGLPGQILRFAQDDIKQLLPDGTLARRSEGDASAWRNFWTCRGLDV